MSSETTTSNENLDAADPLFIRISAFLASIVDFVGKAGSFLFLPMILITMWDVICRKMIWVQIWLVENVSKYFESTLLQELEWHFHTGLFALVLGYGYIKNVHVRVDLVRENLSFRKQIWIEFIGCSLFLIPYCVVIIIFCFRFVESSFVLNEISASLVGLSHRWIIKSVLLAGFVMALFAAVAVWLQMVVLLWGSYAKRFELFTLEWPEDPRDREALFSDPNRKGSMRQATKGDV